MENISLQLLQVTESAAIAAHKLVGIGNEKQADQVAVNAMRNKLNSLEINGTVVIGEGERDQAPMLYIGEKVGKGCGPEIDIALDPLEGTTICAQYKEGSISVIAASAKGNLLHAPDVYMSKIAVGNNLPNKVVSLSYSIEQNILNLAEAKNCKPQDLVISILNRPRHKEIIDRIRKCGPRIKLIDDGDIAAIISIINNKYDMYIGTGGAPEGVIAAAALKSLGGQMEGKLIFDTPELQEYAKKLNINDFNKIYTISDMVKGDSIVIATGVTDGELVKGISINNNCSINNNSILSTHSIIILPNKVMKISNCYC